MAALNPINPLWQPLPAPAQDPDDDVVARRIWHHLSRGGLRVQGCRFLGDRAYLGLRVAIPTKSPLLTPSETFVMLRVFEGKQQKLVSADLLVSPSTTSHRMGRALRKLELQDRSVPLPL